MSDKINEIQLCPNCGDGDGRTVMFSDGGICPVCGKACTVKTGTNAPSDNLHGVVIGLCGKPGAGKDTIGNLLVNVFGFKNATLKKSIEAVVKAIFNINDHQLYDREAREEPLKDWPGWTVRKAMQAMGQAVREIVGEDVWPKSLFLRDGGYDPKCSRIVITDVRTPEDAQYIRQMVADKGGKFILMMVKRPGYGATTSGGFANHKLESYDLEPQCDVVFDNVGSVYDLWDKVIEYMNSVCF